MVESQFLPTISIVRSIYKLVAEVLVGRLAMVMEKLFFSNQFALFKGSFWLGGDCGE